MAFNSLYHKISLFIESYAFLKSKKVQKVDCFRFFLVSIICVKELIWSTELLPFRKPFRPSQIKLLLSDQVVILSLRRLQ